MAKQSFLSLLWISLLILVGALPLSAQTDLFQITYGDTVSNGVPAAGAGNIETGGAQDVYTFDGTAGDDAIFDAMVGGAGTFRWVLTAPDGTALFTGFFTDRRLLLPQTGTYSLTVSGGTATTTGTYSFSLHLTPAPQAFAISFGDTVSDGVPAAGAGQYRSPWCC